MSLVDDVRLVAEPRRGDDDVALIDDTDLRERSGHVDDVRLAGAVPAPAATPARETLPLLHHGGPRLRRVHLPWMSRYVAALVVTDALIAGFASCLALLLGPGTGAGRWTFVLVPVFPVAFVLSVAACRAYEPRFLGVGSEEYRRLFDGAVRMAAALATVSYAFELQLARGFVVLAMPLAAVLALVGRNVARRLLHRAREHGSCAHRVVAVGRERSIAELSRELARAPRAGYVLAGACLDRDGVTDVEGVPVLGSTRDVVDVLRSSGADTLAITAWSDLSPEDLRAFAWNLEGSGVQIIVASRLADVASPRVHLRPLAGLPMLHLEEPEFEGARRVVKGAMDRVVALSALLAAAPLLLMLAVLVRLSTPGPALFRQTRVGRKGREFTMYKFRTMHVDAEQRLASLAHLNECRDGLLFKMRDDPRVTAVGRWLRRLSLDELPQLLNVLRGEMSLVGPRPPLPTEVSSYGNDVKRRLLVKPGLTGLWQISGRSDLQWRESVRLDLYYVENWSLGLDLMILGKTVSAVLRSRGAY